VRAELEAAFKDLRSSSDAMHRPPVQRAIEAVEGMTAW
jgi:hypothetical protein